MKLGTHAVKVLIEGHKRWMFLCPDGSTTYLRIHAATMDSAKAERVAAQIPEQYPDTKAKAVKL